jgi:plasmid stability protein
MIQIRNVPHDIHRKLKARAALAGMSLNGYILKDIGKLAERPTLDEWFKNLRKMKPIKTRESAAETIRAIRNGG